MKSLIRPLAIAALPLAVVACSSMSPGTAGTTAGPTEIPSAIAAPSGATLAVTLKGAGVQNYECRPKADAAGGYDWVFVAPEAVLKDRSDAIVGRHFAGPTWEYGDGSQVTGKVLATVSAPQAGNIPWLLLSATAGGSGRFSGITHVLRVNTQGGVAPAASSILRQ